MDIQRSDLKTSKQRRRIVIAAVSLPILVGAVLLLARMEPAAPAVERDRLWIDTVRRGELVREVRGPGTLQPKEIRWIAAATNGRVERIQVKPGVAVTADTVILELSNPEVNEQAQAAASALAAAEADAASRRVQLESELLSLEADLAALEADHESAKLQVEAEKDLAERGIIPRINFRRTVLNADQLGVRVAKHQQRVQKFESSMRTQLEAENTRVGALRNALALRQQQLDSLSVRAGIEGVLQQVPVEPGQQVVIGANLARVARPGELMAELRIPETQTKDVVLAQHVRVDTRNGIVEGRVIRIDPAVENGSVLVDVELSGTLPAGARPDLSVDGTIEIERIADTLYVGRPSFGTADTEVALFRVGIDGNDAERVPVRLGRASVNLIEVVGGLSEGERIVLSDTSQWDEFDRLRLE